MWFFNAIHAKRSVERRRKTTAQRFVYGYVFDIRPVIDEKLIAAKPLSSGHKLCVQCGPGKKMIKQKGKKY